MKEIQNLIDVVRNALPMGVIAQYGIDWIDDRKFAADIKPFYDALIAAEKIIKEPKSEKTNIDGRRACIVADRAVSGWYHGPAMFWSLLHCANLLRLLSSFLTAPYKFSASIELSL